MRWEQFQLLCLALLIKHLNGSQPAYLIRTIQLAEMAQRPLPRTIGCADRLHQRPVGMLLAVLAAVVRPQKHSGSIVSWEAGGHKRVSLHYITFFPIARLQARHLRRSGG